MKLAYLFSGQGKQFPQMGQDLYAQEPLYRQTIDQAADVLALDLKDASIFDDPQNVQVAILAMSVGLYRVLAQDLPLPAGMLGLSLGEYSALVAAKALDFETSLKLVQDRSRYMAQAAEQNPGVMAAALKTNYDLVAQACEAAQKVGKVYPANYNTPEQVVIGGEATAVAEATRYLKANGIKRVVPLKVSVASHTPLMQPASDLLATRMASVTFTQPAVPVFSNTTTAPFTAASVKDTLISQLVQPTHFSTCLQKLAEVKPDALIELGPGETLTHFAGKTLGRDLASYHVDSMATLTKLRQELEMVAE